MVEKNKIRITKEIGKRKTISRHCKLDTFFGKCRNSVEERKKNMFLYVPE